MDKDEIGRRIKLLRTRNGLIQEELAVRARRYAPAGKRIPRNIYSLYENGVSVPDTWMLLATAKALETSVHFLLGETDDPSPSAKPALTPDPAFWTVVKTLNSQPLYLQKLAAQLIEATLQYAKEYGEWVSSYSGETSTGGDAEQEPAQQVELPGDVRLAGSLAQDLLGQAVAGLEVLESDDATDEPNGDDEHAGVERRNGQ